MSSRNEDNVRATIVDLVTGDFATESSLFRPSLQNGKQAKSNVPDIQVVQIAARLKAVNMLVPGSKLGLGSFDEYRRIKRPLLSNAFGKSSPLVNRGNLIMVTSSIPGEGKTYTAVNLALSIAQERDYTVLLVDCDVSKQGASKILGINGKPGLVDLLENENLSISNVLINTDVPELRVLSSGKQHEYVTELLASQRMEKLIEELISRYNDRVIILDAPPLLPTPQTQILAGLAGQIVFVLEAGKTPQSIVEEALNMLPEEKAIGIVMNKGEGISGNSGYYYDYYNPGKPEE